MTATHESSQDRRPLGHATVSTAEAVGQSLAIGPIVSVGLVSYLIAGAAGAGAPLVVVLVSAGSLALGWCVSLYGRRYAGAGTVYEYLAGAYGKQAGVLGAGFYFLPSLLPAAVPLATGLLFQDFCKSHLDFDPGWWTGGVGSIALVFALSYVGIRPSTRTLLSLTTLSAIPFLVLAVTIIADGGESGNTLSVFDPSGAHVDDLFRGVLFGALIFAGFESAACLGEEARLPHRAIPRAILLSVALAGAFFTLMIYAATIGFGPANVAKTWGMNPVAFAGLGDRYAGQPLSELLSLAILIDNIAVQIAVANTYSRGYFTLARDRLLPRPLARISRHETPTAGLALVSVASAAAIAVAAFYTNHFDVFQLTLVAFTLTLMPVYFALAAGTLRILSGRQLALGIPLAAAGAAVPVLGVYGTIHPFPTGVARDGIWLAAAITTAIAAWFAYLHARHPADLEHAADHTLRPPDAQPNATATPVTSPQQG